MSEMITYQLIVKRRFMLSAKRPAHVVSVFTWKDKEDALKCKELIKKATISKFTDISFSEVVESKPLIS